MSRSALTQVVYRGLTRAARTFESASRLFSHAASGALPRETLSRVIVQEWDHFRSATSVKAGLFRWEKRLFARALRPGDRIFMIGCGAGRDLLPLLDEGYEVDGNDLVPHCIDEARRYVAERNQRSQLFAGPMEDCPIEGQYDVFVFSWCTYMYIQGAETRVNLLRRLAAHLKPGGRILLSHTQVHSPPRRITFQVTRAIARLLDNDWRPEYGDVMLSSGGSFHHFEHYFSPGEEEAEARFAELQTHLPRRERSRDRRLDIGKGAMRMRTVSKLLVAVAVFATATVPANAQQKKSKPAAKATPAEAKAWVESLNGDLKKLWVTSATAEWIKSTYITDDTERNAATLNEEVLAYTARGDQRRAPLRRPQARRRHRSACSTCCAYRSVAAAPTDAKKREELASDRREARRPLRQGQVLRRRRQGQVPRPASSSPR